MVNLFSMWRITRKSRRNHSHRSSIRSSGISIGRVIFSCGEFSWMMYMYSHRKRERYVHLCSTIAVCTCSLCYPICEQFELMLSKWKTWQTNLVLGWLPWMRKGIIYIVFSHFAEWNGCLMARLKSLVSGKCKIKLNPQLYTFVAL